MIIYIMKQYHNDSSEMSYSDISYSVISYSVISYSTSSIKSLNGGLFNNFISSIFYKYSSNDYKELFFILNSLYYKLLQS